MPGRCSAGDFKRHRPKSGRPYTEQPYESRPATPLLPESEAFFARRLWKTFTVTLTYSGAALLRYAPIPVWHSAQIALVKDCPVWSHQTTCGKFLRFHPSDRAVQGPGLQ